MAATCPVVLARQATSLVQEHVHWRSSCQLPMQSIETHACVHGRTPLLNCMLARRLAGLALPRCKMDARVHAPHERYACLYTHPGHAVFEVDVQPLLNGTDTHGLCELLASLVTHRDLHVNDACSGRVTVIVHLAQRLCPADQLVLCLKHLADTCASHASFVFTAASLAWLPEGLRSRCASVRTVQHCNLAATLRSAVAQQGQPLSMDAAMELLARADHDVAAAVVLLASAHAHTQPPPRVLDDLVHTFLFGSNTSMATPMRKKKRGALPPAARQSSLRDMCLRITASGVEIAEVARAVVRVCLIADDDTNVAREVVRLMANMEAACMHTSKELFVLEHYMALLVATVQPRDMLSHSFTHVLQLQEA